jgi:hypothetical protein
MPHQPDVRRMDVSLGRRRRQPEEVVKRGLGLHVEEDSGGGGICAGIISSRRRVGFLAGGVGRSVA